jgi:hypothetical protein
MRARYDDGAFESDERVRVAWPVVEFSEHGARVLADHHRLEVERVSCRVVRRRDTWQTVKEEDKQNEQLLELSIRYSSSRGRSTSTRVPKQGRRLREVEVDRGSAKRYAPSNLTR